MESGVPAAQTYRRQELVESGQTRPGQLVETDFLRRFLVTNVAQSSFPDVDVGRRTKRHVAPGVRYQSPPADAGCGGSRAEPKMGWAPEFWRVTCTSSSIGQTLRSARPRTVSR